MRLKTELMGKQSTCTNTIIISSINYYSECFPPNSSCWWMKTNSEGISAGIPFLTFLKGYAALLKLLKTEIQKNCTFYLLWWCLDNLLQWQTVVQDYFGNEAELPTNNFGIITAKILLKFLKGKVPQNIFTMVLLYTLTCSAEGGWAIFWFNSSL